MKKFYQRPMRQALAVLTAGLVFGGMVTASAQSSVYLMGSNYTAGTVAPYNAGGGVPAQSLIATPIVTSTNCKISWYGMKGWSTVQGSTNLGGNWVNLTNVAATNYAWTTTIPNNLGAGASFRLSQNNGYVGQATCAGCHPDKYAGWTNTPHSYAIREHVNPDGSLKVGSQLSCIKCHSVGNGQPGGYVFNTNAVPSNYTSPLANVGCETCHGPGGWHKASEKDMITPVVSIDPSICGSCHQGAAHPTFTEYTNVNASASSNTPMGVLVTKVNHYGGGHNSFGCGFCHNAVTRNIMINEYYDNLAGNPHPVTFPTSTPSWTATCATCHDPHSSNYVAQMRYPTSSTNYFAMITLTDVRQVVVTNANGSFTTNSVNMNTVMDSLYNPNVQICGQCHGGGRGMRWNGTAYGFVTNLVVTNYVTQAGYVPVTTYVTNVQTFTNISYSYVWTNGTSVPVTNITITTKNYVIPYVTNLVWTPSVATSVTNAAITVGAYYPLLAYTNGTVQYTTNSSGFSVPHYPVQYNILIGQADYDYESVAGVARKTHAHTSAPNQCADCHVPKYATGAHSTTTGHSFVVDFGGCLASCHSSYNPTSLASKVLNQKTTQSNSMDRVVSLLNQWGTSVAPAILRTNYGPLAWEFPSIGALSKRTTNNGVVYSSGPPSAWKASLGAYPSGTNDNLQLSTVPQDIWKARFSLYVIYEDQSLGVHNPTYVSSLLADAETRVMSQFTSANYPASFAATTVAGFAPLSVNFTNYGTASAYSWNFGDGQNYSSYTAANPTYTYNTPGLYSVTCTADGSPLTRTKYISVLAKPVVSFTANSTTITNGQTVTFTNNSSNSGDVFLWRWSPMVGVSGAPAYDTAGGTFSFTYTNAGTYSVSLRASCPGGSANRVTTTNVNYIIVTP